MKSVRESLRGPLGTIIALAVLVLGIVAVYLSIRSGGPTVSDLANRRTFVDAETGKPFEVTVEPGLQVPLRSPSGKMTGVEAELCFWTAEGTPKSRPDAVLLNSRAIPSKPEPTFCPVCHRLVVGHNPVAAEGQKPPPTQDEYRARRDE